MRKLISFAFALAGSSATVFPADRDIAFERNNAVYVANLDGTNEKKIADGIFPAMSPDEKDDSIYRMSTDGKNLKRLIKNARFPSVSAP
jgi:hypothetical protein